QVGRPVPAVERPDVGVGLLELPVLAAGDRQVGDHVQRVPAPGGPAVDDGDHHLGHGADEALHLQDVQAPGAGGVDVVGGVGATDGPARTVGRRVLVAGATADALVPAGAERPAAVLGARAVAGEEHGPDV